MICHCLDDADVILVIMVALVAIAGIILALILR